jgi:hypothetical protein
MSMKLEKISGLDVTITFTTHEMVFLCNAINETLHEVPTASFHTRTRETPEGAEAMLLKLSDILDEARGEKTSSS